MRAAITVTRRASPIQCQRVAHTDQAEILQRPQSRVPLLTLIISRLTMRQTPIKQRVSRRTPRGLVVSRLNRPAAKHFAVQTQSSFYARRHDHNQHGCTIMSMFRFLPELFLLTSNPCPSVQLLATGVTKCVLLHGSHSNGYLSHNFYSVQNPSLSGKPSMTQIILDSHVTRYAVLDPGLQRYWVKLGRVLGGRK